LEEAAQTLDAEHVKCECVKATVSKLGKMDDSNLSSAKAMEFLVTIMFPQNPQKHLSMNIPTVEYGLQSQVNRQD
jgi:hypothetical protein